MKSAGEFSWHSLPASVPDRHAVGISNFPVRTKADFVRRQPSRLYDLRALPWPETTTTEPLGSPRWVAWKLHLYTPGREVNQQRWPDGLSMGNRLAHVALRKEAGFEDFQRAFQPLQDGLGCCGAICLSQTGAGLAPTQ